MQKDKGTNEHEFFCHREEERTSQDIRMQGIREAHLKELKGIEAQGHKPVSLHYFAIF